MLCCFHFFILSLEHIHSTWGRKGGSYNSIHTQKINSECFTAQNLIGQQTENVGDVVTQHESEASFLQLFQGEHIVVATEY